MLGADFFWNFAESKGFEPLRRCRLTVFKTAAIDHSANSPDGNTKVVNKSFGYPLVHQGQRAWQDEQDQEDGGQRSR